MKKFLVRVAIRAVLLHAKWFEFYHRAASV